MPVRHSMRHGKKHMVTYILSIVLSVICSEIFKSLMPPLMFRINRFSELFCARLGYGRMNPEIFSMILIGIGIAFLIGIFHGYQDWKERQEDMLN